MEARETEYIGVKYRSKTEAMFALIIRQKYLENCHRFRLIYEPEKFKTPYGYIPDFKEVYVEEPFLSDFITLYEVKPDFPNKTYIQYLEKQFRWIKEKDYFGFISFYCLYIFNPYKRIFEYILFDFEETPKIEDFERPLWFKDEWFDLALNYRFDLEQTF